MLEPIECREYGSADHTLVLLHGGPGAAGYLAPLAERLSQEFRVLEPLQRRSGEVELTVAQHVADLREIIEQRCDRRPVLVGHSWGAMLAAVFAAEQVDATCGLLMVCSGTFDTDARTRLAERIEQRSDEATMEAIKRLPYEMTDPDQLLLRSAQLQMRPFSHDLLHDTLEVSWCDAKGHHETWHDMVRLQRDGVYPQGLSRIRGPVLMIHGNVDPHPGEMIRDALAPHVSQLVFESLDRCGHYPWLERHAAEPFFERLTTWSRDRFAEST